MYISDKCSFTPYKSNTTLDKKVDDFKYLHVNYDEVIQFLKDNNNYGLDEIFRRSQIEKTNYNIRVYIANQGYGLDSLINDENHNVRWAVVWKGYGLDQLINDENKLVRDTVKFYLKEHNLSLEQWIEQNPNKCILNQDKCLIEKVTKDFIYKIDESNKLKVQTQYDSIDKFFDSDVEDDIKTNTLVVCSVDSKTPLFKIEKVKVNEKTNYKFIIDITNENNDNFSIKSTIQSQEQLTTLIQQTIDSLRNYSQFNKYADELENCL